VSFDLAWKNPLGILPRGNPLQDTNGMENFWSQAKRHLRRFNGIRKETFPLYLKACEWRFYGYSHKPLLTKRKSWVQFHTSTA